MWQGDSAGRLSLRRRRTLWRPSISILPCFSTFDSDNIFFIFAAIIFFVKKKSKKSVLKLRSETCSAIDKLGYVSFDNELTKTKKQSKEEENMSEEV